MKEALLDIGCPDNKLVLNPYGPDHSFFLLNPDLKQKHFVAVGRFVDKKAPYLTIMAFKKVAEKFSDARLIMAGDGYLLNVCRSLSQALGLKDNIVFAGVLNTEEIKVLFENSIAFVQHSSVAENGDSEGTPVAVLEAQAAGLPVISTYHGGIPDVVINEETGLLVEEHDLEGMSQNMIRILQEEGLAQQLGEAGRKRVKKKFTLERHLKIIEEVISNSMESRIR
jgi:glycosyltransferase involved in cell wall biosynthesis